MKPVIFFDNGGSARPKKSYFLLLPNQFYVSKSTI